MEPYTWLCSSIILALSYLYLICYGKSFNPKDYLTELRKKCSIDANSEFMVDLTELCELKELQQELSSKCSSLKKVKS